jgi:short-subunit dehydrogenase
MGTQQGKKLAVITGASSGIGYALAGQAVQHGYDLVICAEDEGIAAAAQALAAGGTSVTPIRADLATSEGVEQLATAITRTGRSIDALLLNAGVGVSGPFLETDLEAEMRMIHLNVCSTVHLAKRLLPGMAARKQGKVLVTASVASTAPTPYHTIYGATKAFDLSFAEGLRVELEPHGITVTALQPGATDTAFFERAGMQDTKVGQSKKDSPDEVAKLGFEAMLAGKDSVVAASLKSKMIGAMNEVLPEAMKSKIQAKQAEPGSGNPREGK